MRRQDGRHVIVVTGHALAPKGTVLYEKNKLVTLAIEVDVNTYEIVRAESTFMTELCNSYLSELLTGCSLKHGTDRARRLIEENFFVSSQRAVIKALEEAYKKLLTIQVKDMTRVSGTKAMNS